MLDRARKTVLAIVNKENRGYMSPSQGDLFFNEGQLEIFEDYFLEYTKWIHKANLRLCNSGYADMPKMLREKIEVFAEEATLAYNGTTLNFDFPADAYFVNELFYLNGTDSREIDEISKKKMRYLEASILTAPSVEYPAYTRYGRAVKVLPSTIIMDVKCDYLRKPLVPKWTYTTVLGNPVHNPSAVDFQDLEIHPSDEPTIIQKVLGYMGIHIREADITKLMNSKDVIDLQKQQ